MDASRQNNPVPRLEISGDLYQAMIAYVQQQAPEEACGLIAFDRGQRAVKVFPGTNVEHSTIRYRMDSDEVVDALGEMEHRGWELGAIFHSHPETPAEPSNTDLQYAFYPNALMVIISLARKDPEVRAFRVDGTVREVPVKVLDVRNGD
jgi:proteasome lid subunit RPN8/RPN11